MMIRAASLPIDVNLLRLSRFMQSQGVAHRISEESGQQVIWVDGDQQAAMVRELLANWPFDEESALATPASNRQSLFNSSAILGKLIQAFLRAPVSFALILACVVVAIISMLGEQPRRVEILFYPLLDASGLMPLLASVDSPVDVLRSLSPMFLHFGELHLAFNMMWLWYFGRQLEDTQSRGWYIVLIISCSFVANTAQYLYSGYNNFGGMSGVVYGLVGYAWIAHTFLPGSQLLINSKMFLVFVIALIAMELVASSWIASAAHLGGLVAGLLLGVAAVVYYRYIRGGEASAR